MPSHSFVPLSARLIGLALLLLAAAPLRAEKADRALPMTIESNPCVVDLAKRTHVCTGNVVITQGTLQIRAERVELRETPEGYTTAQASGSAAKPAQYREKRDGVDEFVEGNALRIDYDGRAGTVRFDGQALVKRLRGATTADEIHGRQIVWNANTEQFTVEGGAPTAANPGGRVRTILVPNPPAASGVPASPAPTLKSTGTLGERR